MSSNSSIEWTDATWNPVTGCDKISPGCKHCYAETFSERFRGVPGHPFEQGFDLRLWPDRINLPLKWKSPKFIFVNSMSDLFHKNVPDKFIEDVFRTMIQAGHHKFQLLTKRPERMAKWFDRTRMQSLGLKSSELPENIWLGVSIENQNYVWRTDHLRQVPAQIRFLSIEPLLGPIEFPPASLKGIHWIIVGGESGHGARPMKKEWALDILLQCKELKIPFFFKQWGTHNSLGIRVGKKNAGRHLSGKTWNQMPRLQLS